VATRLGLLAAGGGRGDDHRRDVLLARDTGARLHICHVSTAGSVEVLRWAKAQGIRVTAEVTPHHLLLTDEQATSHDPVYKVNPPLRTAADVAALRTALAQGCSTWWPPTTRRMPRRTSTAAGRRLGRECSGWRPRCGGLVHRRAGLGRVAQRMSRAPARIAGLDEHGRDPAPGVPANLTLVDPAASRTVDPGDSASRSRNTPFAGMTLPGRIVATFLRGEPTVLSGKAVR